MTSMNDSSTNESTTLLCLFHHDGQARAALDDLYDAGVPESAISVFSRDRQRGAGGSTLESLGIPERDLEHLREGIADGGTIVTVSASPEHVDTVEHIFGRHQATKIDDGPKDDDRAAGPLPKADGVVAHADAVSAGRGVPEGQGERNWPTAGGERMIPVIDEGLEVGKRTVDRGGVRIYRRVIEIPAEGSINLREEHVVVERNAVDRAATEADLEGQGERSIVLTETAEEAVITKSARVVEEIMVGKETGEHTEHIRETLRRTEVEVEELPAGNR